QRHRRRPATVPTLRGQRRLAPHPDHRLRPDRLATPTRLRRHPGPRRTGHPAVPHLPHPGHAHPRRPTPPAEPPTPLAPARPPPGHLRAPVRAASPNLKPAPPIGPPPPPAWTTAPTEATLGATRHATTQKPAPITISHQHASRS